MPAYTAAALTFTTLTLASGFAQAKAPSLDDAAGRYDIDGSSKISFSVDQVGGGGISGSFGKFSGTFQLDGRDIRRSVVEFSLFPESVQTGEERIEKFLRSSAIFDTKTYPKIVFRSTKITQTSDDTAEIEGNLTAKGMTKTEHFTATLTKWNRRVISFHIQGGVYRTRYNMSTGTPIYSNIVQFDMVVNGQKH
ncbi:MULTISPECIES: YceI family protein [unclassified Rhizobium]|uniref:YceI family protein n=1 Tax=unclassified Rhizobium TaxID=2613769 RepID=UPI000713094F|nr:MULTISPECIES: YceI family protein [unclassified Rhizobium]KQS88316.1 polyprenyl-pyrophosphate binding protein [Rhizobium sp. Leaf391]KQT03907.1 polyprenyl-pyrophosphate binding protein [Rhizobium sp. Leaf386]KQT95631.1 polyprenyl-pyrophosphate binding protein [Rhizobium sp. Leaf453]